MTQLLTLRVNLLSTVGQLPERFSQLGGEWLREIFLIIVEKNRKLLENNDMEVSLFHNHDEATGQTLIRYPLIVYHHIGNEFYVTGINQGAKALRLLASVSPGIFFINHDLCLNLKLISDIQVNILLTDSPIRYSLYNWLPLSQSDMGAYSAEPLLGKVSLLEHKLKTHLEDDFGKYMDLPLKGIGVQIEDLLHFDTQRLYYKNHLYFSFSLIFSANAQLPDLITLGNGKAYGFGRVEKSGRSTI